MISGAMTEDELVFKAVEVMKRKVDRLSRSRTRGADAQLACRLSQGND